MSKTIQQPKPIEIFKSRKVSKGNSPACLRAPVCWFSCTPAGTRGLRSPALNWPSVPPFLTVDDQPFIKMLPQYQMKRKHLHCNYVATNASCEWYLLHQLFFSLFQGSGTFLLLLQCCLVTRNQLLNCT